MREILTWPRDVPENPAGRTAERWGVGVGRSTMWKICQTGVVLTSGRSAVLVEDAPLTRILMSSLLESLDFTVVSAATAADGIEAVRETDPDLLVCDLELGAGPSGGYAIKWVEENTPWVAVVVLSIHRDPLLTDAPPLPSRPNRVHLVKEDIVSVADLQAGIDAAMFDTGFSLAPRSEPFTITSDQADVLRLLARGLSNSEIAKARGCSLGAVNNMTQRLYANLALNDDAKINPRACAIALYRSSSVTVV